MGSHKITHAEDDVLRKMAGKHMSDELRMDQLKRGLTMSEKWFGFAQGTQWWYLH